MITHSCLAVACAAALTGASAHAAVITLDFEGLGDLEPVQSFYAGGTGGDGSSGTDFGVEFSDNALAIIDQDAGGTGNFGNEPTPETVLFFLTGNAATLNIADGFETGFSFFYSAINNPGSIDVYSDIDASGDLLATLDLPTTPSETGDPNGQFNVFVPIGVEFDGMARSIDFGGTIDQIAFDNITFGSMDPGEEGGMQDPGMPGPSVVPLPAGLPLLITALGVAAFARRRRTA